MTTDLLLLATEGQHSTTHEEQQCRGRLGDVAAATAGNGLPVGSIRRERLRVEGTQLRITDRRNFQLDSITHNCIATTNDDIVVVIGTVGEFSKFGSNL